MPLRPLTLEDAIAYAKGDLGKQFLSVAGSYVTPIFWEKQDPGQSVKLSNGSTFFVDAGRGPFGVTARHVFDAYVEEKRRFGRLCYVGMDNVKFDLEERLVSRGRRIDIATYRILPDEIPRLGVPVRVEPSWPPRRPTLDRGVFYGGFPGVGRRQLAERIIEWNGYVALGVASTITEQDIVSRIDRDNLIAATGFDMPEVGYDVRGLSGAPLFALWESEALSWTLAGVIYDGGGGAIVEHVRAAHADLIGADGVVHG